MEKIERNSFNILEDNIKVIKDHFPSAISDGKIDFETLKVLLGDEIENSKERYQFTWPGKYNSIRIAQFPSSATLRPEKKKSKNWDSTNNLYIEGDNLEVLKQLQKTYYKQIKLIYFDPPYNTGNDFVYKDNFGSSLNSYFQQTNQVNKTNPETNGRFHSDWCSMIYSRLLLARNLLAENGIIVISIGYNEVHNLTKICQELFETHQVFAITVQTSGGKPNGAFNISCEYLVYIVPEGYTAIPTEDDMKEYSSAYHGMNLATFNQVQRPNQTYPIYVSEDGVITGCGKSLQERINDGTYSGDPADFVFDYSEAPKGSVAVWPVTAKGDQCVWRLIPERLLSDWAKGYIKVVPQKGQSKNVFAIQYLSGGIIDKINSGDLQTYRVSNNPDIPTLEINDYKTAGSGISSIWTDKNFYTTKGTNEIRDLFDGKVFSYPKPLALMSYILKRAVTGNDIVLDFFSGSSTTAHALMKLNCENNLNCSFIMVQLPETVPVDSDAFKAGYRTICDIGEERIRRAGEKIKKEWEDKKKSAGLFAEEKEFPVDIGFKVFKLDSTNIMPWDNENEFDERSLFTMNNVFKEDRTKDDVLYEILLKYGIFDQPITEIDVNEKTLYRVGRRHMIVCLEDDVTEKDIVAIGNLSPRVVVFKEAGFKNDNDKINAEYNLKKAGVEDVKCV